MLTFGTEEAGVAGAAFDRLFPSDELGPGAVAIGVLDYVDRALAGAYGEAREAYRQGLAALDAAARARHGVPFDACAGADQDALLARLAQGRLNRMPAADQESFFALLRSHLHEGLFADPLYGGNRDKAGWAFLGHPGVWRENSAAEALSAEPATKGGEIRSLADLDREPEAPEPDHTVALPAAWRSTEPPSGPADVVLVGVGAVGSLIAPALARAGLRVVGLEAGPWRRQRDYRLDELGSTHYGRASMSGKFLSEVPRWRPNAGAPARAPVFGLGKMVNGVGGSAVHWGGWLRRFHPHHFRLRTHVHERWGARALPPDCTLTDWPIGYEELEPYYARAEAMIGVAGDSANPFVPRSGPHPMPPLRPFRLGERFRRAATSLELHPYTIPAGVNSVPYAGRPASSYSAWCTTGFGPFRPERWHPGLDAVPEAVASGNFDLKTGCRVLRICTDGDGAASGVEYVDPHGRVHRQPARAVVLCSYTYENVRLLFLSVGGRHPAGPGNDRGQLGRHFFVKTAHAVSGLFPDEVLNAHTGPEAQACAVDDFTSAGFDAAAHGFVGGGTLAVANGALPIQITRRPLPPDVPGWGSGYKAFLRQWQHVGQVGSVVDAMPYAANRLELDPHHRDRSGWGLPVLRVTFEHQSNEVRAAAWLRRRQEELLRAMGASRVWADPAGDRQTVFTSHEHGGCRMGDDPAESVVDADLAVHDTPGLYVFSGATFPSTPGINPSLTLFAVCLRAAERLVARLNTGGPRHAAGR